MRAGYKLVILMTMTSLPLAEVKAHLSELISRVSTQHDRVIVTVHGHPSAVLLAPDDLQRLEETIAVLADHDLIAELVSSESDLDSGRLESAEELEKAMKLRRMRA